MMENIARVSENSGGRGATWGDCMERQTYGNVGTCMRSYRYSDLACHPRHLLFFHLPFPYSLSLLPYPPSFFVFFLPASNSLSLPPTPSPFFNLHLQSLIHISIIKSHCQLHDGVSNYISNSFLTSSSPK